MVKKSYLTLVSDNQHPVRTVTFSRIEKLSGLFETPAGVSFLEASRSLEAQNAQALRVIEEQEAFLRRGLDSGNSGKIGLSFE